MKKLLFILASFTSIGITSKAQTWDSLGSGMGGFSPSNVRALAVYNGNLYAGGYFTIAGGNSAINYIGEWNGSNWSALGTGMDGQVNALTIYNGDLYAGGHFSVAGGQAAQNIAEWNGSAWSANPSAGTGGAIYAMTVYNGSLTYSNGVGNIVEWNGSSYTYLANSITKSVNSFIVYNSNLYVGGYFDSIGGKPVHCIAEWNGTSWSTLGTGMDGIFQPNVAALAVYNGKLIAGGNFLTAGGNSISYIAEWDGTSWSPLGTGVNNMVQSLTVYNGNLIAGGWFTTAGGNPVNYIAQWNGTSWSSLGSGMGGTYIPAIVYSLTINSNKLFAGGVFTTAGGNPANYIAEWNSPSGINEIYNNNSVSVFPNPCDGIFKINFTGSLLSNTKIELYNLLGEKVYSATLYTEKPEINISGQAGGVYFYRIISENGSVISNGKIVIQ